MAKCSDMLGVRANPPLEVIKGFLTRIWEGYEIDKIWMARRGVFLVRF